MSPAGSSVGAPLPGSSCWRFVLLVELGHSCSSRASSSRCTVSALPPLSRDSHLASPAPRRAIASPPPRLGRSSSTSRSFPGRGKPCPGCECGPCSHPSRPRSSASYPGISRSLSWAWRRPGQRSPPHVSRPGGLHIREFLWPRHAACGVGESLRGTTMMLPYPSSSIGTSVTVVAAGLERLRRAGRPWLRPVVAAPDWWPGSSSPARCAERMPSSTPYPAGRRRVVATTSAAPHGLSCSILAPSQPARGAGTHAPDGAGRAGATSRAPSLLPPALPPAAFQQPSARVHSRRSDSSPVRTACS